MKFFPHGQLPVCGERVHQSFVVLVKLRFPGCLILTFMDFNTTGEIKKNNNQDKNGTMDAYTHNQYQESEPLQYTPIVGTIDATSHRDHQVVGSLDTQGQQGSSFALTFFGCEWILRFTLHYMRPIPSYISVTY
jgi:hypothetical protein